MRKSDCIHFENCKCSCQNCIQYKSKTVKNRDGLIMFYVGEYMNDENNGCEKEEIKNVAKGFLTEKEYKVFLFEIQNKGI